MVNFGKKNHLSGQPDLRDKGKILPAGIDFQEASGKRYFL
jgi:hypothetical protein